MRHLSAPGLERLESIGIPAGFAKAYAPHGEVSLADEVAVDAPGLDLVELDGQTLAIEPDTVSWTFLGRRETAVLAELARGRSVGWLRQAWPADALAPADEFVARLFRRGLVRLDGRTSVAPDIFHDSPNRREGRLVELLVTEKCNLACGYCLAGAHPKMPHMSPEVARRTIDLAYKVRSPDSITFEFSGGEPFLRFDLMRELVAYIRDHPARADRAVYVTLQTNGTLLDEERVAWIADNQVIVGLSLDGDPASHNRSRPQVNGKESFSKVLRGVDLLQRAGIGFGVLVVLNRSNVGSAQALIDFLVDNGIGSVKLNTVAYLGTGRAGWDAFGLREDEVIGYFQDFARRVVDQGHSLFEANLFDMVRHLVSKQRHSRCLRGHCGAGESFNAIAADGSIYPCGRATQSPGLKLGHVADAWSGLDEPGRRNLHVQQIRERRPKTLEDCVTCSYRELCQAGCSAQAYERYGTVRHKTPECAFNKTMYPYLMRWLAFDERAVGFFSRGPYFAEGGGLVVERRAVLPD